MAPLDPHRRPRVLSQVDFRQLYFRTSHKLSVNRACEPSDVIWRNLRHEKWRGRRQNVKTTLIVLGVSCISTVAITFSNYSSITHSQGVSTTLWVTGVIILSNVIIFIIVPTMAYAIETHYFLSSLHLHMLLKLVFFQVRTLRGVP